MTRIPQFNEVIGEWTRAYRSRHGITKDMLARRGTHYGATWGTASISNIEAGRASLTLPVLYALMQSLQDLGREDATLARALAGHSRLRLAGDHEIDVQDLLTFLASERVPHSIGNSIDWTLSEMRAGVHVYSLAERRAAVRLGISPSELVGHSYELWGERLDDVVTHATGTSSTPQARGHETRRRMAELQRVIDEAQAQEKAATNG